jgi:hypothetical protein
VICAPGYDGVNLAIQRTAHRARLSLSRAPVAQRQLGHWCALCVPDLVSRRRHLVSMHARTHISVGSFSGGAPGTTILVGYPTNRRAKAVLSVAGMLARSSGEDVVVCTAIRDPRVPGITREDTAFRSVLGRRSLYRGSPADRKQARATVFRAGRSSTRVTSQPRSSPTSTAT